MSNQLQTVESVIVLMLENRGFDNVMGFLHTDDGNKTPNGDPYNGLTGNETNPANSDGTSLVPVQREMNDSTVPDPDPHEQFDFVTEQLFIPKGMYNKGFVIDYGTVKNATAADIMRCYDASLTPCLQHIANHYAVCDAWYSSVPSQTWPNRSFVHCGWSNGQVYNAVVGSKQWKDNKVLFIITHDEHGGTYDHVTPPSDATPPTQGTGDEDFDFTRFGVRVPFVIVSPYIPKGSVIQVPQGKTFDHTSILATLEKLYNLPALKNREKVAPDLGDT